MKTLKIYMKGPTIYLFLWFGAKVLTFTNSTPLANRVGGLPQGSLLGGSSQDGRKWLITMVIVKSPKDGVVGPLPNGRTSWLSMGVIRWSYLPSGVIPKIYTNSPTLKTEVVAEQEAQVPNTPTPPHHGVGKVVEPFGKSTFWTFTGGYTVDGFKNPAI